jgi:hypothetical protein
MFDAWVNVLMYELWTYKWTNVRRISHLPINLCFQCTMSMCKTYELWTNEFCTIFIIKSWDAKFVMIGILNYIKLYKLWTIWLCSNYMIIWLYVICVWWHNNTHTISMVGKYNCFHKCSFFSWYYNTYFYLFIIGFGLYTF